VDSLIEESEAARRSRLFKEFVKLAQVRLVDEDEPMSHVEFYDAADELLDELDTQKQSSANGLGIGSVTAAFRVWEIERRLSGDFGDTRVADIASRAIANFPGVAGDTFAQIHKKMRQDPTVSFTEAHDAVIQELAAMEPGPLAD
jgi:hypothetical protein